MIESNLEASCFEFDFVESRQHSVASNEVISWSTDHPYTHLILVELTIQNQCLNRFLKTCSNGHIRIKAFVLKAR